MVCLLLHSFPCFLVSSEQLFTCGMEESRVIVTLLNAKILLYNMCSASSHSFKRHIRLRSFYMAILISLCVLLIRIPDAPYLGNSSPVILFFTIFYTLWISSETRRVFFTKTTIYKKGPLQWIRDNAVASR